ncbi:MAG: Gfo/Idh/MocA family oxidoreductase [Firmicutes bacterium]|nr:Gfo/Idh/MocA family oxidoreductase [Bacillota bacterium]
MDKLRIGIIGAGGIAGAHAYAYQRMDDVEVIAAADVVPGRAAEFLGRYGFHQGQAFEDYRDLLQLDLDGVSICTPNVAHFQTAVDALTAGKHVLVEKPLSFTLAQATEMVRTSKQRDRMLTVGFQPRYDPNMKLVRDIVRSGVLGQVYYLQTGGGRRRGMPGGTFIRKELAGSGAIADIGCYSLDLVLDALDYPLPLTVSAFTSNHFGTNPAYHAEADRFDVEDFGVALVRLEGDIVLNFKIAWAMHMDTLGPTLFLGTDAGLRLTPSSTGPWGGIWDGGIGSITLFADQFGQHTETIVPVKEHEVDRFYEKVRDFVMAIREGRPAPIPAEQILRNQAIIDGVLQSAALGREVAIEIPEV